MGMVWVKHEFEIADGKVTYWNEDAKEIIEKGGYHLKDCIVTECASGEQDAPVGTFPFKIEGSGRSIDSTWELMLSANEENERTDWIKFIKDYFRNG